MKKPKKRIYVTVETEVEVTPSEFDDETLINEVRDRGLAGALIDPSLRGAVGTSLLDELKLKVILGGYRGKTLDEIEQFFKS